MLINVYPYGMLMPNRKGNTGLYRYGFTGMENDDEIKGDGNSIDFGARMYDPRIGRWFSPDPLETKHPSISTYAYVANRPIIAIDVDGRDWKVVVNHETRTITIVANFTTINMTDDFVQSAANDWIAQSGRYNYIIDNGDEEISYAVNFDISVNDAREGVPNNTITVLPDDAPIFKSRPQLDALGNPTGNTIFPQGGANGKAISLKDSEKENTRNIAHEIAHNLGSGHNGGLMGETAQSKLNKKTVGVILRESGIGTKRGENQRGATFMGLAIEGNEEAPINFQDGKVKKNKEHEVTPF